MIWTGRLSKKELDAGARFRAVHSSFLTKALALGRLGRRYPRIPAKRVDEGGFGYGGRGGCLKLPEHQKRTAAWWAAAMNRMDRADQGGRRAAGR